MNRPVLLWIGAILCISFLTSGCATLIGLGVGSAIDASKEPYRDIESGDAKTLAPGVMVRLTFRDSTFSIGKFEGFTGLSNGIARMPPNSVLPFHSESIKMIDIYGRSRQTRFGAFYFKMENGKYKPFLLIEADSAWVPYDWKLLKGIIKGDADTVAKSAITTEFGQSELPIGVALLLSKQNEIVSYSAVSVARLEVEVPRNAGKRWATVGLVIDIIWNTLIFIALKSLPED